MTDVLGFQEYTEKLQQMPKIRILDLFQKRYLHSVIVSIFPFHYSGLYLKLWSIMLISFLD